MNDLIFRTFNDLVGSGQKVKSFDPISSLFDTYAELMLKTWQCHTMLPVSDRTRGVLVT